MIDLEKVKAEGVLDFQKIKQILQSQGMVPVGVRGGESDQHEAAATIGLPMLSMGNKSAPVEAEPVSVPEPEVSDVPLATVQRIHQTTKFITTPIRSGMQVYARGGDLVVVAPVSAGAELMADGHIHIYGPLRGRALAGVQGDTNARIFCQQLEAELVSIAGYYLVKEDLHALPKQDGMVQIYLENDEVRIQPVN